MRFLALPYRDHRLAPRAIQATDFPGHACTWPCRYIKVVSKLARTRTFHRCGHALGLARRQGRQGPDGAQ
jgi:hypothetical protein